jgi:hypothetical protein
MNTSIFLYIRRDPRSSTTTTTTTTTFVCRAAQWNDEVSDYLEVAAASLLPSKAVGWQLHQNY